MKVCSIDGCDRVHYGRGLCSMHNQRLRRTGDASKDGRKSNRLCEIEGCDRQHYGYGLCQFHYRRTKSGVDLNAPKRTWANASCIQEIRWTKSTHGYVVGFMKGKQYLQHRIVWEQHHGRVLHPFENIHHINGIRDDNRIENLELWTKAQPCGQRPEDLVKWVVENYPDLVAKQMKKGKGSGRSNSQTRTRVNGMAKASTSRRGR